MPSVQAGQVIRLGGSWGVRYYAEDGKRRRQGGFATRSAPAHGSTTRWRKSLHFGGRPLRDPPPRNAHGRTNSWTSTSGSTTRRQTRSAPAPPVFGTRPKDRA